jgi:hypothetical protein
MDQLEAFSLLDTDGTCVAEVLGRKVHRDNEHRMQLFS